MRVRASRFPEGSLLNVMFCITHACTLPIAVRRVLVNPKC